MSFADKVVIVTGGSAGIGAATAVEFAREGAKVVIVGRNEENLKKVAEKCQALNGDCYVVKADITKETDATRIVEETIKKYGKLDILINNAGIFKICSVLDGQLIKVYDEVMNTNLRAMVVLTHLAAPYLIKTKGNIVNISAGAATKVIGVGWQIYSTSKAAINTFTEGTASEMASYGVRVNAVTPGPVKTVMLQNALGDVPAEPFTALNRVSDPEEIADVILFLASDKAKGITGSNYVCDNGVHVKV